MQGFDNRVFGGLQAVLDRRVVVDFGWAGMILEYAATYAEAWEFATAAAQVGLSVRVDGKVRPGLRPLPCRRLWG
ncbi:hypothetical protein [Nocardia sp. NPDC127526]|uniref:hypothetical protein n=1 Tax=Nocardia sp. NPDC127526 TaxID=3345393 RepID=UPI0036288469